VKGIELLMPRQRLGDNIMFKQVISHSVFALWLGGAATVALAQGSPVDATQGFWLQGTVLGASLKSAFRTSSGFSDFKGTDLQLEADYGLPSKRAVGNLAAGMRLGTRWRLEGEVLWVDRSGSAVTLTRELTFDDYTYPVKTTVRASLSYQAVRFGGGFAFVNSESAEVGVSVGLLGSTTKARIELAGSSVGSGSILPQVSRSNTNLMPMVGVYGRNSFGADWGLAWRMEGARNVGGGSYDGSATNLSLMAHWRATPNVALHAGARYFVARSESNNVPQLFFASGSYSSTTTKVSMSGPQAGLTLSF
jgi:hypothetical protein